MKKYEYNVAYRISADDGLTSFLNQMGKKGFRLVPAITKVNEEYCYIFEREYEGFEDEDY